MGQSKGGGYTRQDTLIPEQLSALVQALNQGGSNSAAAAEGYKSFLPGGSGNNPIQEAANKNFQQSTIPNILNSFGAGNKGSTSLNQALASGGADLNTNLGAILAQNQLSASQGLAGLGSGQQQLGLGTPAFAYTQNQPPMWQSLLLSLLGGGSEIAKGWASNGFKT